MIVLNHIVKLVAEIDENKMPDALLNILVTLPEKELNKMLAETFIGACNNLNTLEKLNENNAYATIKWGDN